MGARDSTVAVARRLSIYLLAYGILFAVLQVLISFAVVRGVMAGATSVGDLVYAAGTVLSSLIVGVAFATAIASTLLYSAVKEGLPGASGKGLLGASLLVYGWSIEALGLGVTILGGASYTRLMTFLGLAMSVGALALIVLGVYFYSHQLRKLESQLIGGGEGTIWKLFLLQVTPLIGPLTLLLSAILMLAYTTRPSSPPEHQGSG